MISTPCRVAGDIVSITPTYSFARALTLYLLTHLFSSFSKIFRTKSKDVVDECMLLFGCSSVLIVVNKRKAKFLDDYLKYYNNLCKLFAYIAENEKRGIKMIL